ncbi:hypothetical protein ACGFYU_29800 [Streptomyces sp. NPDC048337]|uniref:hypothetical protein n=1 Tax=Streptomyces sp. NPDC048337 TaxID=3365535 RepID=UPI00371C737E
MSKSSKKASSVGNGKPGQFPVRDKDKGKPGNHKKTRRSAAAQQTPPPSGTRGGTRNEGPYKRPVEIWIGLGHPETTPGTFDAAALLASLLSAVEPKTEAGLSALSETIRAAEGENGSETARALRAVGKQIADSLRAGVIEGMRARDRHLAQLAVIDRAAAHATSLRQLQERIEAELGLAGLLRVTEPGDLSVFNLVQPGSAAATALPTSGDDYEVVSPAYTDTETRRTVERGWVRLAQAAGTDQTPRGKDHGRTSRPHQQRKQVPGDEPGGTPQDNGQPKATTGEPAAHRAPAERREEAEPRGTVASHAERVVDRQGNGSTGRQRPDTSPSDRLPLRRRHTRAAAEGSQTAMPEDRTAASARHTSPQEEALGSAPDSRSGAPRSTRARPSTGTAAPALHTFRTKLLGSAPASKSDDSENQGDQ